MAEFKIKNRSVGSGHPCYFIAELGANHDGALDRALALIDLAKQSGADAVKFQHYRADTLASKYGFDKIKNLAHYSDNPHTVFRQYETPWEWTQILYVYCLSLGLAFISTPYDMDAVDHLEPYVDAYKIGSGDITYTQLIRHIGKKRKPTLISCGASTFSDVLRAMQALPAEKICLMQCNTNYTGKDENYGSLNLRVLKVFRETMPYAVLGFSDHALGNVGVLGAVALGAKVIEKHFTDGHSSSPDNAFALRPAEFRGMVDDVRRLEAALGDGVKRVEANEVETVVLQRRCLRAARDLKAGAVLTEADIVALRPAPEGSYPPYMLSKLIGKVLAVDMVKEEEFDTLSFEINFKR